MCVLTPTSSNRPIYDNFTPAVATVTECGFDPNSGHVLVVYDARNPEFAAGGVAGRQYESAISACRVPGLIRRLSWQHLVDAFTCAPELAYLLAGLEGKYGIRAE